MAEKLFIADKKTLDEVNKKLDNFSGGTDWSKYTCEIATGNNSSKIFKTVLDVSGKGILKSIGCRFQSGTSVNIKLTLDGNTKEFETHSNLIIFYCVFNNNLKLEIKPHADNYWVTTETTYGLER